MHARRQRGWVQRVEARRPCIRIRQRLRLDRLIVLVRQFGAEETEVGVCPSFRKPREQLLAQTNESFIAAASQTDPFGDGLVER